MDNQEQLSATSRAEYIRMARESCSRNIGNGTNKNYGAKNKENIKYEKQGTWNPPDMKSLTMPEKGVAFSSFHLKTMLIRITLALALFLSVFLFDKFGVKINNFSSADVQSLISSNQSIDEAENFFVNLYEKLVKAED
jgi:hypothetical protein